MQFHLASGESEISKAEDHCDVDNDLQSAVRADLSSLDHGYDEDSLSDISDWSSLWDEYDDDDDMSSFTTVSELSDYTCDLFDESSSSSTLDLSFCEDDDDALDNSEIAQLILEQLLSEIV